ncbi:hypothetical protein HS048_18905 [Planomonospora sp. ID91781]|uniref:FXSXX-COOH protein n=1 Tax=Planomonospora sphaerica TaxID=161355 RepID=A0A171DNJ4_9ACTN|nr:MULTISPECIES: hypothetical protein [Planomonospora]MBG0822809.1 hypothetical protein [Planomonospora sp. ID91781]GAT70628.1 hypothetical protein PS9374_06314 [Planomonospora sphaerica]
MREGEAGSEAAAVLIDLDGISLEDVREIGNDGLNRMLRSLLLDDRPPLAGFSASIKAQSGAA